MEPASQLIDRVIYTASLATNVQKIDPILNRLREITARVDVSEPLNESDRATILSVQSQLETYLVKEESLRYFTPDSLRLQIERHERGESRKTALQLAVILVVACTVAIGVALLPFLDGMRQRFLSGGATAFSLIHIGAAWLFLTALPAFHSQLRRAFMIICTGVTLLGLTLLIQPAMEIFKLYQYPIFSLLFPLPILIAGVLFHLGDVAYVKLVGVKNVWTTAWPMLIVGVAWSVVTYFLPHAATNEPEWVHDLAAIMWVWVSLTPMSSAIILPMAARKLPELYKRPIRLLSYSMFPIMAVTLFQYTLRVTAGPYVEGYTAFILPALVVIMGLVLLRAGYEFNQVSRY